MTAPLPSTSKRDWREIWPRIRPVYEHWGPQVTAAIYRLPAAGVQAAARMHKAAYRAPALRAGVAPLEQRVTAARAWMAERGIAAPDAPGAQQVVTVDRGQPPTVTVDSSWPTASTPAHGAGARYTRIEPRIDPRRMPTVPQAIFAGTAPGIDPMTGEGWR